MSLRCQAENIYVLYFLNIGPFSFQFYVCGFPNDSPQRVKKFAIGRTRFMIMSLTAHYPRIAVGDCRDGILFFSYQEVGDGSVLFANINA